MVTGISDGDVTWRTVAVPATAEVGRADKVIAGLAICGAARTLSRTTIAAALRSGDIRVNDRVIAPHVRISGGDVIAYRTRLCAVPPAIVPRADVRVRRLFVTQDFVIVVKPCGILTHPAPGVAQEEGSVAQALLAWDPAMAHVGDDPARPGIVHRLDRDTSGIMVAARTQRAFDALKRAFAAREVAKTYYAITCGVPPERTGQITFPIARRRSGEGYTALRTARDIHRGCARTAQTLYMVVAHSGGRAAVILQPRTGRTHQLRVHLRTIGCPIIGDALYARGTCARGATRLLLHAIALRFDYDGQTYAFAIPPDAEFAQMWGRICAQNMLQ